MQIFFSPIRLFARRRGSEELRTGKNPKTLCRLSEPPSKAGEETDEFLNIHTRAWPRNFAGKPFRKNGHAIQSFTAICASFKTTEPLSLFKSSPRSFPRCEAYASSREEESARNFKINLGPFLKSRRCSHRCLTRSETAPPQHERCTVADPVKFRVFALTFAFRSRGKFKWERPWSRRFHEKTLGKSTHSNQEDRPFPGEVPKCQLPLQSGLFTVFSMAKKSTTYFLARPACRCFPRGPLIYLVLSKLMGIHRVRYLRVFSLD